MTAATDTDLQPRLRHVPCVGPRGLHRMAYWDWAPAGHGAGSGRTAVCVHGLSRQGRDFDTLARDLAAEGWRVVCPDVVGRGRSDRLADPLGYAIPTYVADMVTLLARLDVEAVDWVGTSMGGLIGLGVAALRGSPPGTHGAAAGQPPQGALVRRLVLNDVGPVIEAAALARIGGYLGKPVRWASVEEAADAMWAVSQGFGPHTREQWLALSRPQLVADGQGGFVPHVDPAIAVPFAAVTPELAAAGSAALWAAYDSLAMPVLLLRGAESDLLSHATAQAMAARGPRAQLVEFPGVGHAPMLQAADQRAAVLGFLRGG